MCLLRNLCSLELEYVYYIGDNKRFKEIVNKAKYYLNRKVYFDKYYKFLKYIATNVLSKIPQIS